jgi:thiamine phosphate synthase YjbQ (UPF0047 family)
MANDRIRRGSAKATGKSKKLDRSKHGSAIKKHAKKAVKPAAKHASRKHAKKSAKHVGEKVAGVTQKSGRREGLLAAFQAMQRASVVISLMEKGTGEDLRDLLERGVKLYADAVKEDGGERKVLRTLGLLRAAEHLSLAGLYAARHKHRQKVAAPAPEWLAAFVAETDHRLEKVEHTERSKGPDLYPVTVELLRQAEDADHDAHLASELAMAAEALCCALENGL